MRQLFLTIAFTAILLSSTTSAEQLRVLAWNVESGGSSSQDPANGNDPATIEDHLEAFEGYHIVALTEVRFQNIDRYTTAAAVGENANFQRIHTETGGGDRMVIIFDSDRFDLVSSTELHSHGSFPLNFVNSSGNFRFRSPLVAHLRDSKCGCEFLVMVNHLARGDNSARRQQARGLREWADDQTLPVVMLGDFNFDFDFTTNDGNQAFEIFTDGGILEWIRPQADVDTNWADDDPTLPNNQRTDRFPNSILDFVFVAKGAKNWNGQSSVIIRPGDFPDSGDTSDHRPVDCTFTLPTREIDTAEILRRIAEIRRMLDELEGFVRP